MSEALQHNTFTVEKPADASNGGTRDQAAFDTGIKSTGIKSTGIQGTAKQDVAVSAQPFAVTPITIIVCGFIGLITLVSFCWWLWQEQLHTDMRVKRAELRIASVTRGDLRREIAATGKIVVANSPTLYSSADGIVTYNVKAGDRVKQGQLLLSVESPALTSRFQQANAVLARLQTELAGRELSAQKNQLEAKQALQFSELTLRNAQRDFSRYEQGFNKGFVSRQEFERAEENLHIAELKAQQAPEQLILITRVTKTEIQNTAKQIEEQQSIVNELLREVNALQVRSPVDAMVGNLSVNQKSAVAMHQALITVIDLSHYEVEIEVPENYAPELVPGMAVEIKLDNNIYTGAIIAIAPEVNAGQVKVRLKFTGDEPQHLRQNQRITAIILLEVREGVLKLPRGLYAELDNGKSVFKVNGNKAIKTPVTYGVWGLDDIEVTNGLTLNDEIIVSDTSAFRAAQSLYIKQ
ncbi:efflux RND transporter periplasmic adaptor subunit [Cellvibrio mixtus]|uniref:efflux RND transporter periplasmic adaptor subunit n=1 Tax=Cellvibrio mixtus TaxID=39650 RepID=UPI000694B261|nr:HlyD family efflux transporter periplasmic adaptor subunit [Cellvibrio mixtus]